MDSYMPHEPRYVPGYEGHCSQFRFRSGDTFSRLTHKLFLHPSVTHAPNLLLTDIQKVKRVNRPTQEELDTVEKRKGRIEAIYDSNMAPGYDGFIPRMYTKVGDRFNIAVTTSVAEYENIMEYLRCDRRHQLHSDMLQSGHGVFLPKMNERTMSATHYHQPLLPVMPRSRGQVNHKSCFVKPPKEPYTRFNSPLFLECDDKEKWIVYGYNGHVPCFKKLFGSSYVKLTHDALCDFLNIRRYQQRGMWCKFDKPNFVLSNTCPLCGDFIIYRDDEGMIPHYGGHVPGANAKISCSFQNCTKNGKHEIYLSRERMQKSRIEQGFPPSELYQVEERSCEDADLLKRRKC